MDLSKLSDADLMALKANDLSKMSDEGLMALKGGQSVAPQTQSAEMPVSESNFAETGGGAAVGRPMRNVDHRGIGQAPAVILLQQTVMLVQAQRADLELIIFSVLAPKVEPSVTAIRERKASPKGVSPGCNGPENSPLFKGNVPISMG
jgi:hypothetical protein